MTRQYTGASNPTIHRASTDLVVPACLINPRMFLSVLVERFSAYKLQFQEPVVNHFQRRVSLIRDKATLDSQSKIQQ